MAAGQVGSTYSNVRLVQQEPDQLLRAFTVLADAVRGCRLVTVSPQAILLERRFVPIWALLMMPIGIAMVVLELLGVHAKQVETLAITLSAEHGATRVSATGVANPELAERLDELLESTADPAETPPPQ
ncbi:MAG TPA: hypothetical protein VLC09_09865 [Polyangiaceae bacterium]|nr:hypothetical protein [Polyangiaceae bacterium]